MDASARAILEIGLLVLLAVAAGWGARRIGLPAIVGYLAAGLVVSPFTPGPVADHDQLELLADVGVVLLLFEVGVDVTQHHLRRGGLAWAAPLQVVLTTAVVAGAGLALGLPPRGAVLIGLAVAFSSSVVVVNIIRSRRRTTSRATEEALLGWSVLQDLTGVILTGVVLAAIGLSDRPAALQLGGLVLFAGIAVAAAWLMPRVLRLLHDQHDHFLMVSVAAALALAGVGARFFGIPLALSAFVSGLAVAESPVMAEARRRLLPFRDLFAVLFFVAVGTLIDPAAVPRSLGWFALILVALTVAKVGPILLLTRLLKLPGVNRWQMAIGLGQVGEFSFVVGTLGVSRGFVPASLYTGLLLAMAVSIAATATLARVIGRAGHASPDADSSEVRTGTGADR